MSETAKGKPKKIKSLCSTADCGKVAVGRGLCRKHLTYWNRGFNPTLSNELSTVVELEDDLLTEIAKRPATTADHIMHKKTFSEVQMFAIARQLRKGDGVIQGRLVYYYYTQWTPKPMSFDEFNPQFRRFFDKEVHVHTVFYKLDPTPFIELAGKGIAEVKNGKFYFVEKEET